MLESQRITAQLTAESEISIADQDKQGQEGERSRVGRRPPEPPQGPRKGKGRGKTKGEKGTEGRGKMAGKQDRQYQHYFIVCLVVLAAILSHSILSSPFVFGTNLQTAATFILGYSFYCFYKQLPPSTASEPRVATRHNELLASKCEHDEWFTQTVLMTFAWDDQEEINSRD